MPKINNLDDLKKLRETAQAALKTRAAEVKAKVRVSMGTAGIAAGARDTLKALITELEKHSFGDVKIVEDPTLGPDKDEPIICVERDGFVTQYVKVSADMARKIAAQHIVNGQAVAEWAVARSKK